MAPPPARSADTTREAEAAQHALLRAMPPWRKLELWAELCASARALTEAGLRRRFPTADDREIRMRLFATWLDRDTMIRAYGWDPVEHGAHS